MAQKINSNIFRLGIKKNEWKYKYFENTKEEFSLYAYQSLEIKKFLQRFLTINGLMFHDFKLQYTDNTLHIFISYYTTSKAALLVNKINTDQKLKVKKRNFYLKPKKKRKKTTQIISLKKRLFKLRRFFSIYYKSNKKTKKCFRKKYIRKFKDEKTQYIVKKQLKKRIILLKNYKNNLKMKNYKNVHHLKLNSFSEQLLESLSIYTNKKFNIFITFQNLNKGLSLNLNNSQAKFLKKKLLELRHESRNKFFKKTINILVITVIIENSAQLLAEFIASQLSIMKKHNFFLIFIKRFLITLLSEKNFSNISGVKFTIKGRFNGAPRAHQRNYVIGNVPIQTIDANINYYQATSYTSNGTFGIKVWICKKKKNVFATKKTKI